MSKQTFRHFVLQEIFPSLPVILYSTLPLIFYETLQRHKGIKALSHDSTPSSTELSLACAEKAIISYLDGAWIQDHRSFNIFCLHRIYVGKHNPHTLNLADCADEHWSPFVTIESLIFPFSTKLWISSNLGPWLIYQCDHLSIAFVLQWRQFALELIYEVKPHRTTLININIRCCF